MSTYNPELTAVNLVRQEAEQAGVLEAYVLFSAFLEGLPIRLLTIQERRELIQRLVAEKEVAHG